MIVKFIPTYVPQTYIPHASVIVEQAKEGVQTVGNWGVDFFTYREQFLHTAIEKLQEFSDSLDWGSFSGLLETLKTFDHHQTVAFQELIRDLFQISEQNAEIHAFLTEPIYNMLTALVQLISPIVQSIF